ncbi:magnesium or manganese-dependent protein phosphatase [Streptomyces purpurascens]
MEQPGADLDDGMRTLAALVATGPDDVRNLADRLIDVAAERCGDDDVALLLLRRRGPDGPQIRPPAPAARGPGRPGGPGRGPAHDPHRGRRLGAGDRADEIELVADELITNALMHTEGSAIVALPGPHRLRAPAARRGRGLLQRPAAPPRGGRVGRLRAGLLVELLTDVWGVEARGGGKAVWCSWWYRPRLTPRGTLDLCRNSPRSRRSRTS